MRRHRANYRRFCWATIALLVGGCTVHPPGERQERAAATDAGAPFEKPFEQREIPSLPEHPSAEDLVRCAMLSSADLESRYWQWRAAIEQVPQDATQATTFNAALGSSFTRGRTSSGMTTLAAGNDPMTDIKWPGKLDAAARVALQNARASGLRFRKAQFDLRNKVIAAYDDYALTAELIRLSEANQQLLATAVNVSEARNRAGSGGQQDVLKARTEADLAANDIANLRAQLPAQRAAINALLGRSADAPLPVPERLPEARPLAYNQAQILAMVRERNPELSAQQAEILARHDAVRLARLQYFPDFNLSLGTDLAGITQNLVGQATVPWFRREALDAAIAQAQANLRSVEAMRRQTQTDLAAEVVLELSTLADADRQLELFTGTILPRARQMVDLTRGSYESARAGLLDLLDARRTLISAERVVANLRALRDKRLADLEAICARNLASEP